MFFCQWTCRSCPGGPTPIAALCALRASITHRCRHFKTVWPSGLRRWLQAPVRKGVGSNPTAVTLSAAVGLLACGPVVAIARGTPRAAFPSALVGDASPRGLCRRLLSSLALLCAASVLHAALLGCCLGCSPRCFTVLHVASVLPWLLSVRAALALPWRFARRFGTSIRRSACSTCCLQSLRGREGMAE